MLKVVQRQFSFRAVLAILLIGCASLSSIYADSWHCNVLPLTDLMAINQQIDYIACVPPTLFEHPKLPLAQDHYLHPYRGSFKEHFVLTIDGGQVFGQDGWVLINDTLIHELIWQNVYLSQYALNEAKKNSAIIKKGRVAVIAQTGFHYYYHWMVEILGRLALLEMKGIEYDFLYVPTSKPHMKETLVLWGIDEAKIIEANDEYLVSPDTLIVPSLVSSVAVDGCPRLVHYIPHYIVAYIRKKLLRAVEQDENNYQFSKRVFISRQDAGSRIIINEDDVFSLLETHGFERYHLAKMSVREQIILFKNAEIIVGTIGSGLTNLMFCNQDVQIIELYQARRDCTIWNLSQMLQLRNHTCIKTTDFIDQNEGQYDTAIPLNIIEELLLKLIF